MTPKSILLVTLVTTSSLFFWTITPNYFATPKEVVYSLFLIAISLITIYYLSVKKSLRLPSFNTVIPLIMFVISVSLSLIFNPEGRPEALGSKASILLTLPIIALYINYHASTTLRNTFLNTLVAVGSLLSLHSLLSLIVFSKLAWLPQYMQTQSFTPTGSYLTTLFLIIISLSITIYQLKKMSHGVYYKVALLIFHIVAVVAIVAQMMPGNPLSPELLPYSSSWSIALDALKSIRSLFFGIGISNYSLLYTSVRPLAINASELFNLLPQSATSELLTLLPTAGLLSTISLIYLMIITLYHARTTTLFTPTIITIIAFFLIPSSLIQYLLLFIVYGLVSKEPSIEHIALKHKSNIIISILVLFLTAAYLYPTVSNYASEYFINASRVAIAGGESQKAYESHLRALSISPKISNYYISFADINFRLALALSQKPNLSDEDRQNVSKLIQQSIESCKNAIALRPNDSRSWVALAKIYQNLITVAQGADNFALEAYTKAVSLDRANPELRVELGNLFSQLASLPKNASSSSVLRQRALNEISTSLQLKNDFAAAYYSLARIFKETNETDKAQAAYDLALKYLDPNSPEYARVLSEKNQPESTKAPSPSPIPSPIGGGQIDLPTEELNN